MNTIQTQRKTTATHQVALASDGRADGSVQNYVVATRKLRNGKPFGATHTKSFRSIEEATAAFEAK